MTKIEFKNLPDTSTPLSAENLNTMQDNIENAIDNVSIDLDNAVSTSSTNGVENQAITNYVNDKVLDTYSTTEQRIGTWIDGKPLYRKTFNVNSISTSNTDLVDITGLNYSQIVKVYGMLNTDNNQHFPIPLTDSSANYSVIFATTTALRGRAAVGSGNFANAWLAIEYTKSTD